MEVDLNADLGEGFGPWRMGDDEALLDVLSSANVACGFHAGDPLIMQRTVEAALARGVDVGAHVGFPDRQGFGRRVMQVEVGRARRLCDLPARCARRHRPGGRPPHVPHELPWRAREHGCRGRRCGQPARRSRGALRSKPHCRVVGKQRHRGGRDALRLAGRHHVPGRSRLRCRGSSRAATAAELRHPRRGDGARACQASASRRHRQNL